MDICSQCSEILTKDEISKPLKLLDIQICLECKEELYKDIIKKGRAQPRDFDYQNDLRDLGYQYNLDYHEIFDDDDINTKMSKMVENMKFERNEKKRIHAEKEQRLRDQEKKLLKDELKLDLEAELRGVPQLSYFEPSSLLKPGNQGSSAPFGRRDGRAKPAPNPSLIGGLRGLPFGTRVEQNGSLSGPVASKTDKEGLLDPFGKGGRKKTKKFKKTKKIKKIKKIKKTYKRR